jgi:hypothetical protein
MVQSFNAKRINIKLPKGENLRQQLELASQHFNAHQRETEREKLNIMTQIREMENTRGVTRTEFAFLAG